LLVCRHMHNQVLVYRGKEIESKHTFTYVVSDSNAKPLPGSDTIEKMIYPRSAIKPFQAISYITTGTYAASGSTDEELSLACASHNAEKIHVNCVQNWLQRNSLSAKHLACGPALPDHKEDIQFLYENKISPDSTYNNCSGKHTAMVLTARHMGWDMATYNKAGHPLQKMILDNIETLCNKKLDQNRVGIDGCTLPNYMMSLQELSIAAVNFTNAAEKSQTVFDKACNQILNAIAKYPIMIGGHGRLCSKIAEVTEGRIIAKVGAEGIYVAMIRDQKLGIALKIEDGAFRAVEVALVHLLKKFDLLKPQELEKLQKWVESPIYNTVKDRVGKITAIV
jgi:L-asparaginase II